jgi:putative transposase
MPAEHRDHLRTTNPIESVFATVRHRTVGTIASWRSDCEAAGGGATGGGALSPTTAKL